MLLNKGYKLNPTAASATSEVLLTRSDLVRDTEMAMVFYLVLNRKYGYMKITVVSRVL